MVQTWAWIGLVALSAVRGVVAQDPTSITPIMFLGALPTCTLPCMESGIQAAGCSTADIGLLANCLCTNFAMQTEFNACIQTSCVNNADRLVGLYVQAQLCQPFPKPNRSNVLIVAAIVGILIAVPVIVARLATRWTYTNRLWADDYVSIFTLVVFLALAGILIVSANMGLGLHIWTIELGNAVPLMQIFFTSQVMYIIVQCSARVAILLLYRQIFDTGSTPWFGTLLKVCLVLQVVKESIFLFLIIFECLPISAMWDKSITDAKCLDLSAISLAGAICSIATDVVLAMLPIPMLWKLQVSRAKRVGIAFVFVVASLGVVASIVRLTYLIQLSSSYDDTWNNVDVTIWSLIEILCMIVCGSIPALRPLLARVLPSVSMSVSWSKSRESKGTPKASGYSTGGSSSRYSAAHFHDSQNASYSLSPLSSAAPKGRWDELDDVPEMPGHGGARYQVQALHDVEAAIPRVGAGQPRRPSGSGSENNLIAT